MKMDDLDAEVITRLSGEFGVSIPSFNLGKEGSLRLMRNILGIFDPILMEEKKLTSLKDVKFYLRNLDLEYLAPKPTDLLVPRKLNRLVSGIMDKVEAKYGKDLPSHLRKLNYHPKVLKQHVPLMDRNIPRGSEIPRTPLRTLENMIPTGREIPRTPDDSVDDSGALAYYAMPDILGSMASCVTDRRHNSIENSATMQAHRKSVSFVVPAAKKPKDLAENIGPSLKAQNETGVKSQAIFEDVGNSSKTWDTPGMRDQAILENVEGSLKTWDTPGMKDQAIFEDVGNSSKTWDTPGMKDQAILENVEGSLKLCDMPGMKDQAILENVEGSLKLCDMPGMKDQAILENVEGSLKLCDRDVEVDDKPSTSLSKEPEKDLEHCKSISFTVSANSFRKLPKVHDYQGVSAVKKPIPKAQKGREGGRNQLMANEESPVIDVEENKDHLGSISFLSASRSPKRPKEHVTHQDSSSCESAIKMPNFENICKKQGQKQRPETLKRVGRRKAKANVMPSAVDAEERRDCGLHKSIGFVEAACSPPERPSKCTSLHDSPSLTKKYLETAGEPCDVKSAQRRAGAKRKVKENDKVQTFVVNDEIVGSRRTSTSFVVPACSPPEGPSKCTSPHDSPSLTKKYLETLGEPCNVKSARRRVGVRRKVKENDKVQTFVVNDEIVGSCRRSTSFVVPACSPPDGPSKYTSLHDSPSLKKSYLETTGEPCDVKSAQRRVGVRRKVKENDKVQTFVVNDEIVGSRRRSTSFVVPACSPPDGPSKYTSLHDSPSLKKSYLETTGEPCDAKSAQRRVGARRKVKENEKVQTLVVNDEIVGNRRTSISFVVPACSPPKRRRVQLENAREKQGSKDVIQASKMQNRVGRRKAKIHDEQPADEIQKDQGFVVPSLRVARRQKKNIRVKEDSTLNASLGVAPNGSQLNANVDKKYLPVRRSSSFALPPSRALGSSKKNIATKDLPRDTSFVVASNLSVRRSSSFALPPNRAPGLPENFVKEKDLPTSFVIPSSVHEDSTFAISSHTSTNRQANNIAQNNDQPQKAGSTGPLCSSPMSKVKQRGRPRKNKNEGFDVCLENVSPIRSTPPVAESPDLMSAKRLRGSRKQRDATPALNTTFVKEAPSITTNAYGRTRRAAAAKADEKRKLQELSNTLKRPTRSRKAAAVSAKPASVTKKESKRQKAGAMKEGPSSPTTSNIRNKYQDKAVQTPEGNKSPAMRRLSRIPIPVKEKDRTRRE